MSSVTDHREHSERPERSRNAKAQARHRAKRKAYIAQLEATVTKLQSALGVSPEQATSLPPPLAKIRELEQENARLHKENEEIRRVLAETGVRGPPSSFDMTRRNSTLSTFHDGRACDRDFKKRKMAGDEVYMVGPGSVYKLTGSSDTPPHENDIVPRPPPLTIPPPMSHQYGISSHHSSSHNGTGSSSLFSLHGPAFQLPNTPSGSSSASSPPFSPDQMQPSSHSPVNHRHSFSNHHSLSSYPHSTNHYGTVKVEEEHYAPSNHNPPHSGHYSLPTYTHTGTDHGMDSWHAYSSERAQLRR